MTRVHRALAALIALVAIAAVLTVAAVTSATPARPAAVPVAAAVGTDDAHLVRVAILRANRDHRRAVLAHARAVAAARARARAAAAQRAARAAAAEKAARDSQTASSVVTSSVGVTAVWQALAGCESGGNWHDTDGDYEGGIQFLNSTWLAYGGGRYAAHAYDATPLEQVTIGRKVLNADGPSQWPVCGPRVHLQRGD